MFVIYCPATKGFIDSYNKVVYDHRKAHAFELHECAEQTQRSVTGDLPFFVMHKDEINA